MRKKNWFLSTLNVLQATMRKGRNNPTLFLSAVIDTVNLCPLNRMKEGRRMEGSREGIKMKKKKKGKRNPKELKIERSMRFQSLSNSPPPYQSFDKIHLFPRLISFLVDKTSLKLSVKTFILYV